LRIAAVVQVVAVVVIDVNVIGGVPVVGPVFRPRIEHHERISLVLETRISQIHNWDPTEVEVVLPAEIETEASLRNIVAAIPAALRPSSMVGGPVLGAILLPGIAPLPAAAL